MVLTIIVAPPLAWATVAFGWLDAVSDDWLVQVALVTIGVRFVLAAVLQGISIRRRG